MSAQTTHLEPQAPPLHARLVGEAAHAVAPPGLLLRGEVGGVDRRGAGEHQRVSISHELADDGRLADLPERELLAARDELLPRGRHARGALHGREELARGRRRVQRQRVLGAAEAHDERELRHRARGRVRVCVYACAWVGVGVCEWVWVGECARTRARARRSSRARAAARARARARGP